MSQEDKYAQTWNERVKGAPHQSPPPSKVNLSERLNSVGLYAERAFAEAAVIIKTKDHKEVVKLSGTDLSVMNTPEDTLELVKKALAPYGYTLN